MSFTVLPQTIESQSAASNPENSVFVSANAGSGKTTVLSQRVLRLLLAGTEPSRILCLTYTNAAAAEMQTRIFNQLRDWSVLSDEELDATLFKLEGVEQGGEAGNLARRKRARRLFAQALETPGGLRVQTIHAFCQALLQQFPLEAGIAGKFEVLDDEMRERLLAKAKSDVIVSAESQASSEQGQALSAILELTSEFGFHAGVDKLIDKRFDFRNWMPDRQSFEPAMRALFERLGLEADSTPSRTIEAHWSKIMPPKEFLIIQSQIDEISSSRFEPQAKLAARLAELQSSSAEGLALLADFLIKKTDPLPKTAAYLASKDVHKELPSLKDIYTQCAENLVPVLGKINDLKAANATRHLAIIGHYILLAFENEKRSRGLLDFNDLVARTAHLLTRRHMSA